MLAPKKLHFLLIGGKMKSLFFTLALLLSTQAFANNKFAEKLVIKEIEQYSSYYQVEELEAVEFTGIINNKYNFSVFYKTNFCLDIGDDERGYCATYQCQGAAQVDGDAVVSLTFETDAKNCQKVPNSDFTIAW